MNTWKSGMALAAVAALATLPMLSTAAHAGTMCTEEFADSAASSHCALEVLQQRPHGSRKLCIYSISCSMSFTYGEASSGDDRPTYTVTLLESSLGNYLVYMSDMDLCTTERVMPDDSVSYSTRLELGACKEDEYSSSEVLDGQFHK